jgi:hypothetical protein
MKITKNKISLIKQNSRNTMPTMKTVTKVKQSKKLYNRRDGKNISQF